MLESVQVPAKLRHLLLLLENLARHRPRDWRVVIFTGRKETQAFLGRFLEERGISCGFIRGGSPRENVESIHRFRLEPPGAHALISTDAGAEGINLQVANVLINYDLPWNPMLVEQRIGRIQRLASQHANVAVVNIVVKGTVEERVVLRLMEKLQLISHTIGDVESILEATALDESGSFEEKIRELVVRSLIGQDVEEATRLQALSIEEARTMLDEQRAEIDDKLGVLNKLHETGPKMPRLTRAVPSLSAKEFALGTLAADGARWQECPTALYEVSYADGSTETVCFDEDQMPPFEPGVFMGKQVRLFVPGKRDFERLVQRWVENDAHRIEEVGGRTAELAEGLAKGWCEKIPTASFDKCEFVPTSQGFQGEITTHIKVGNPLDSYEKIVTLPVHSKGHSPVAPGAGELLGKDLVPSEIVPSLPAGVESRVSIDKDVQAFTSFYEERRREEVAKQGMDEHSKRKLESDFATQLKAGLVAFRGVKYEVGDLHISFRLDGQGEYRVTVQAVPAARQVLREPDRGMCEETGWEGPAPCLGTCAITGRVALRHLLIASETSGRLALASHVTRCPRSGKTVLEDELSVSALTGQTAASPLFQASPVSRRLGLEEDFARCEVTGAHVLRDELIVSQVSGRRFRMDEARTSGVSGVRGHRSEFATCAATGQSILPEEAGKSDVSGQTVRKNLLVRSTKAPGRVGLRDELVRCALSGRVLLRDEVAASQYSGKLVDRDLLVRCAKTGRSALASELVECDITHQKVLPDQLETCVVTGKRALRERFVRNGFGKGYMLTSHAVRSAISGKMCHPKEAFRCPWTGQTVHLSESEECNLTGLRFSVSALNDRRELAALRDLLDGGSLDAKDGTRVLLPWLATLNMECLRGARQVIYLESPSAPFWALCVENSRWLGLSVQHVGLLLSVGTENIVVGNAAVGRRTQRGWEGKTQMQSAVPRGRLVSSEERPQ
jgi:hypothetical protein